MGTQRLISINESGLLNDAPSSIPHKGGPPLKPRGRVRGVEVSGALRVWLRRDVQTGTPQNVVASEATLPCSLTLSNAANMDFVCDYAEINQYTENSSLAWGVKEQINVKELQVLGIGRSKNHNI